MSWTAARMRKRVPRAIARIPQLPLMKGFAPALQLTPGAYVAGPEPYQPRGKANPRRMGVDPQPQFVQNTGQFAGAGSADASISRSASATRSSLSRSTPLLPSAASCQEHAATTATKSAAVERWRAAPHLTAAGGAQEADDESLLSPPSLLGVCFGPPPRSAMPPLHAVVVMNANRRRLRMSSSG